MRAARRRRAGDVPPASGIHPPAENEDPAVSPVTNFPEPSINKASKKMISQHRSEFAACRILRQRHTIEWLPLTKVDYIWKGAEYHYYVYGKENRAYAKDYPRKYRAIKRNDG
ncbi:hypothetical protein GDO78_014646 [Eleutherodactylus coqui]|uniref:Uncharacterized protein n=1 Tax=Eleutherodactylus coqui TaxID=57060 RepID=A0A8J6E479_ELECQ|nr:hypothetical protein GDO78_014646 [Eleutherodactylus coqui]